MLHDRAQAADKRAAFRAGLASGNLLRLPGAFNPLSARLIEQHGFEGVYVSGAVISADLGLPDIGLTTLTEVAGRAQQIARVTGLPTLADADTTIAAHGSQEILLGQMQHRRDLYDLLDYQGYAAFDSSIRRGR